MRVYVSLAATVLVGLLVGCSSASKAPQSKEAAARATDADEQILKTDPLERNYDPHVIMKDRKSTRLNSSHLVISYAVFCLKKKKMKSSSSDASIMENY